MCVLCVFLFSYTEIQFQKNVCLHMCVKCVYTHFSCYPYLSPIKHTLSVIRAL
ncbi:MAG: hypothetical protein BYD32DRAFT_409247 [Podila humilis]|nr:MAG: hypothetical protein BYD32DRAFT_409247 [Podila humilis]